MRIPKDKILHFAAGAAIFVLFQSMLPVILIGVGKEVYDAMHPKTHTVDALDALATFAGGAVANIAITLL
jgi:hypothetical protein